MKVLLLKEVRGLGKVGEIHEVKDGYGQNFLIAKGMAKIATNDVINQWKAQEKKRLEQEAQELIMLKDLGAKLGEMTVKITKKVGANGSLYGAITKEEISEALAKQKNLQVDKKNFELKAPIKSTGLYEIDVKLGHGIHAKLKVDVEGGEHV